VKKLLITTIALLALFSLTGIASAEIFFHDEVLDDGSYIFDGSTNTMVLSVKTKYMPYDENGNYLSGRGSGTLINWKFTAKFDDDIDLVEDGSWEEFWARGSRSGPFDSVSYTRTGTNDLGQNTGDFYAVWSDVTGGTSGPLAPEGPWYAMLNITRKEFEGSGDTYWASGSVTGVITNEPVPEPGTILLLGMGLLGVFGIHRKKSQKA
jgi:hypothetical protein